MFAHPASIFSFSSFCRTFSTQQTAMSQSEDDEKENPKGTFLEQIDSVAEEDEEKGSKEREGGADEEDKTGDISDTISIEAFNSILRHMAGFGLDEEPDDFKPVLENTTMEEIAKGIKEGKFGKRIVVLSGAGLSTAAGVPDFRSPTTGLYHNLDAYGLEDPTDIFDIAFFQENPKPFFQLCRELLPKGDLKPTIGHYFIRLLHEKGLLLRNYTQNIDGLEHTARVPDEKVVYAHGWFNTAHCTKCNSEFDDKHVREAVHRGDVPTCSVCKEGVVKPDIVFFGEHLPMRFGMLHKTDMEKCDLLLIMGTSLAVFPVCSLVHMCKNMVPRVVFNKTSVVHSYLTATDVALRRDVEILGDLQDSCLKFAKLLGWEEDLVSLMKQ
eukprot:TRINITY_DN3064_c0_g1_i1.p1 TRINITY_DN3064_c0_g1~~TRINITY_DN3064_c0_g1_i1.p1  ORF type:complete len:382 (-),score=95.12 TRINITY_DN3064_c0_g1_i1:77-1222(-)